MANTGDITHSLKASADGQIFLTRLVKDASGNWLPKVSATKDAESKVTALSNVTLARLTGESIAGKTETLESNELRKGRTPSKKKLGTESSEGSLDIEFSADTFDDLLAAGLRSEWHDWTSDSKVTISGSETVSPINPKGNDYVECEDGQLITRWTDGTFNSDETFKAQKLLGADGLIKEATGTSYTVKELTIGSDDIKFDLLRKLGGITGEDLYQRYENMNVNTFSLDVSINSIVTGSFGFMGTNSPKRLDTTGVEGAYPSTFYDTTTTPADYIENLDMVKATSTDQFVSTQGNLWINGQNITWGENLTIEINNNLVQKNAIFVKKAIATVANTLDVTGNYQSYVVKGKSEDVYNAAVDNTTNEIMFLFQDNETDPTNMYLFQVFKSSFDAPSSSASNDTYEDTLAWTSFEERAVRILKITKTA